MAFGGSAFGFGSSFGANARKKIVPRKPTERVLTEVEAGFRQRKADSLVDFKDKVDPRFILVLVFQNEPQKAEVLELLEYDNQRQYVDGVEFMDRAGIELEIGTRGMVRARVDQKLAALTGDNTNGEVQK